MCYEIKRQCCNLLEYLVSSNLPSHLLIVSWTGYRYLRRAIFFYQQKLVNLVLVKCYFSGFITFLLHKIEAMIVYFEHTYLHYPMSMFITSSTTPSSITSPVCSNLTCSLLFGLKCRFLWSYKEPKVLNFRWHMSHSTAGSMW